MDINTHTNYSPETVPPSGAASHAFMLSSEEVSDFWRLTRLQSRPADDSSVYIIPESALMQHDIKDFCPDLAPETVCVVTMQEDGVTGRFEAVGVAPGKAFNYTNIMAKVLLDQGKMYTPDQIQYLADELRVSSGIWQVRTNAAGNYISVIGENARINVAVENGNVMFADPFDPAGALTVDVESFRDILSSQWSITTEDKVAYQKYLDSLEAAKSRGEFTEAIKIPLFVVVVGLGAYGLSQALQIKKAKRQEGIKRRRESGFEPESFGDQVFHEVHEILSDAGSKTRSASKRTIDKAIQGVEFEPFMAGLQVREIAKNIAKEILDKEKREKAR